MSMAMAKHFGKLQSMSRDAKDIFNDQWMLHLAYKMMRNVPKFSENTIEESISAPNQRQ